MGKSKSQNHPNGLRRRNIRAEVLAPRSARRRFWLLSRCTEESLKNARVERFNNEKDYA